jgi:ATP synthase protein I
MALPSSHRGEMSQDSQPASSLMPAVHPRKVRGIADPAARSSKRAYNALSASSVGLELGIAVGLGLAAGWFLDKWLGTEPWMLLSWMVLGLVAGFRGVFRAIARADRAAAEEEIVAAAQVPTATATEVPRG